MKLKWIFLFFIVFAGIGYAREFFFVHLNNIMYIKYYGHSSLSIPKIMNAFNTLSYTKIYYLKYVFTLVWVILFFTISYLALKKLSQNLKLNTILIYLYTTLLTLAALAMIYGYFFKNRLQDDEYTFSRWLLGIAQSPIICLILLASEKLYKKSFQKNN
jgi:uncharacterized membrane protein